jgi:vitamin B12 transporter
MSRNILIVGALSAFLPTVVSSQARSDSTTLPPVVVTATRLPVTTGAATTATAVVSGESLRAAGITDVLTALRNLVGVDVVRAGSAGAQTSLFMRGGESDYVRVLVDGVPVNDPGGAFDFGGLTTDNIDRIEVVRGPASVLYGSDAVAGVVQIFTRAGLRGSAWDGSVRAGSLGARDGSLAWRAGSSRVSTSLAVASHRSNGSLAFNNEYRNDVGSVRVTTANAGRTTGSFAVRFSDDEYHYPTNSAGRVEDRNAKRGTRRAVASVDGTHAFSPVWQLAGGAGVSDARGRTIDAQDDAADTLGFYVYRNRGHTVRQYAESRLNAFVRGDVVTIGGEWSREAQRSRDSSNYDISPNRFAAARETRAVFVQGTGGHGPLAYTLGGRLDRSSTYGDFRTWRASAAVRLSDVLSVRGGAGTAFKAPTFFETFSTAFSTGNAALHPERSRGWDAGIEWHAGSSVARATWFDQKFRNLIQYAYQPPPAPNYFNVAAASSRGLEIEARAPLTAMLTVAAAGTLLHTRVDDAGFDAGAGPGATFVPGERLIRRADRSGSLTLLAHPTGRISGSATLNYVGRRSDRDFSAFPAAPLTLGGYARADAAGEYRLPGTRDARSLFLTLRVENLLDRRYQEVAGFAAPGRVVMAGLRFGALP